MSDNTRLRALLRSYADEAPTLDVPTDVWEQGRARRRRGRYAGASVVVLAVALAMLTFGAIDWRIPSRSMPAGPVGPTPSATETPNRDLEFPMLPSRADHATPVVGSPQLRLTTWTLQTRHEVAIYPDGLVIWDSPSGYQQMRLNPTGIATIWSSVLSTGLFDPQDDGVGLVANVPSSSLIVNRGGQWVTVQWAKHPASWMGHVVQTTPSQEQKLAAVYQLLHDPSDWSLSRDLYADPEVKPFWTSTYYLGYDRSRWNLSKLPEPIAHLVAGLSQRTCSHPVGLTATRNLIDALVEAGFKPIDNTPFDVGFDVPGTHGVSFLHISPDIPVTCDYPQ